MLFDFLFFCPEHLGTQLYIVIICINEFSEFTLFFRYIMIETIFYSWIFMCTCVASVPLRHITLYIIYVIILKRLNDSLSYMIYLICCATNVSQSIIALLGYIE